MSNSDDPKDTENKSNIHEEETSLIELDETSTLPEPTKTAFEENLEKPISSSYTKWGMRFNGSYFEYYKIWLVNLILSILTLGIYTAWAKVRKKKYLYANTSLAGATFDFHANPVAILKGRLIVGAIYAIFIIASKIEPAFGIAALILFYLAIPWLFVRIFIFKLTNTTYRNIRFNFFRNYSSSYKVFFLTSLVSLLTLGLGSIWAINRIMKFVFDNARFGKTDFEYIGKSKALYGNIFLSVLVIVFCYTAVVFGAVLIYGEQSQDLQLMIQKLSFALPTSIFVLFYWTKIRFQAVFFNNTLNHLKLGNISFRGKATPFAYFKLQAGNLFLILSTLGLTYPITSIRNHRFRIDNLRLRL